MLKIAILEASHWHVPMYLPGLDSTKVKVVAVPVPILITKVAALVPFWSAVWLDTALDRIESF